MNPFHLHYVNQKWRRHLRERWATMQEANKQQTQRICEDGCSMCTGKRHETYCWSIQKGEWTLSESESNMKTKITTKWRLHTFSRSVFGYRPLVTNYR